MTPLNMALSVHSHVTSHRVDILALLETRVRVGKENSLLRKWKNGNQANNMFKSRNGQIWLFWRDKVILNISRKTNQLIHTKILGESSTLLQVSFIYASNSLDEKLLLWNDLRDLRLSIKGPWCLMGDFNVVLSLAEIHSPGRDITQDRSM